MYLPIHLSFCWCRLSICMYVCLSVCLHVVVTLGVELLITVAKVLPLVLVQF